MANKVEVIVTTKDLASSAFAGMAKQLAILAIAFIGVKKAVEGTVGAFSDFEKELANVSTLVDTSAVNMDEMAQGIIALSKEVNQLPIDVVRGMYLTISAGAKPGKEAFDILRESAKLATSGLTDTRIAVDVLTTAINAYGLQASDSGRIADVLFKTVELGKTTVGELAGSLGRAIPIAASLNISLEELTAATATLTKGGLGTEEAVTALRNSMLAFVKNAKEFEDAGIDIQKVLSERGLLGGLESLRTLTQGNIQEMLKFVPNIRALQGVLALTGKQFEEYNIILAKNNKALGANEVAFIKQTNTLSAKTKALGIELKSVGLSIGGAFAPVLKQIVDASTQTVKDLRIIFGAIPILFSDIASFIRVQWNRALVDPEFFNKAIANWNKFALQLGGVLGALFSSLFNLIKEASTFLFAPLFEASIFIWEKIAAGAKSLWQQVKNIFIAGVIKINETIKKIPGFGKLVSDEGVAELKSKLATGVKSFQDLRDEAKNVTFQVDTLEGTMAIAADNLNNALQEAKDNAVLLGQVLTFEGLVNTIGKLFAAFEAEQAKLREMIKETGETIKTTTGEVAVKGQIDFEAWLGSANTALESLQEISRGVFQSFQDGMGNAVVDVINKTEDMASSMKKLFKQIRDDMIRLVIKQGILLVAKALLALGTGGGSAGIGAATGAASSGGGVGAAFATLFKQSPGADSIIPSAIKGQGPPGGGVVIQKLNLSLFENTSPSDVILNMPTKKIMELTEQKILPALNKLGNVGASTTLQQKRNR